MSLESTVGEIGVSILSMKLGLEDIGALECTLPRKERFNNILNQSDKNVDQVIDYVAH